VPFLYKPSYSSMGNQRDGRSAFYYSKRSNLTIRKRCVLNDTIRTWLKLLKYAFSYVIRHYSSQNHFFFKMCSKFLKASREHTLMTNFNFMQFIKNLHGQS
jgi:hypothetical protein